MGNRMKFIVIIGLVVIIPALVNRAFATKVVPLPDLLKPGLVRVDKNQMYIAEGANVYNERAFYPDRDIDLLDIKIPDFRNRDRQIIYILQTACG